MALVACLSGAACATAAGQAFIQGEDDGPRAPEHRGWSSPANKKTWPESGVASVTNESAASPSPLAPPSATGQTDEAIEIALQGAGATPARAFKNGERFRNTYYDFPKEDAGAKDAAIYDATCALLANVTREFHDRVCVQGSGRLSTGETVSFAKRDCACADVCPRTSQKICFERLDPARFPAGRGALGKPITPLRTVAVDSSVIPLGTTLFIPEFKGVALPTGGRHDGCFVAEDRGLSVQGAHVDVFTGHKEITKLWNRLVPSNSGVTIVIDSPRCSRAAAR